MVNYIVKEFKIDDFCFCVEFDTGGSVGGEISVYITDILDRFYITRTFYFNEQNDRHIFNFAKKFVRDPLYRKNCIYETAKWVRLTKWYEKNSGFYYDKLLTQKGYIVGNKKQEMEYRYQVASLEENMEKLYHLLHKNLEKLEGSEEYQKFQSIEKRTPIPSINCLDNNIKESVLFFNGIPGVETEFSCQGSNGYIEIPEWQFGPIWFPGKHCDLAYITFSKIPVNLFKELVQFLQERKVGTSRFLLSYISNKTESSDNTEFRTIPGGVQSIDPRCNNDFILALEEFAANKYEFFPAEDDIIKIKKSWIKPPLTDKELAIARWNFGKDSVKKDLIQEWIKLTESEKFSLGRKYLEYIKYKKRFKRHLPAALLYFDEKLTDRELFEKWRELPGEQRTKINNNYQKLKQSLKNNEYFRNQ